MKSVTGLSHFHLAKLLMRRLPLSKGGFIAAPRSVCCRHCYWVSRRAIWKRRQRDCHAALEPYRLFGIHRRGFAVARHHPGNADCFRGILAIASAGLGNRVVEHWGGDSRNDCGFPSHNGYWRPALVDRNGNSGVGVRSFFFAITKRKSIQGSFAGSVGGKSSDLLAAPAGC